MIIWTHASMAEQIYERMTARYGQRLNRNAFIRGNVLPDISKRYRRLSHHTEDCWELVTRLTVEMDGLLCGTERGSERMGVICHFLADFFCSVHNPPFSERMPLLDHLLYEYRVDRHYRHLLRTDSFGDSWLGTESAIERFDSGRHWFSEALSARQKAYANTLLSPDWDLREAMGACVTYYGLLIALEDRQLSPYRFDTPQTA